MLSNLIIVCVGWLSGIYLAVEFSPSPFIIFPLLVVSVGLIVFSLRKPGMRWYGIVLFIFATGLLRCQLHDYEINRGELVQYNNAQVMAIRGEIEGDVKEVVGRVGVRLKSVSLYVEGKWEKTEGKLLAYLPLVPDWSVEREYPYYKRGDLLQISGGKFEEKTAKPANEKEPLTDYWDYLQQQGILYVYKYPRDIDLIATHTGIEPLLWIDEVRIKLLQSLQSAIISPQSDMAGAILLGYRTNIPEDILNDFNRTGTTHILAISGHNLSILLAIIFTSAIWLFGRHRPFYFWFSIITIWLYYFVAGSGVTVLRAAIMGNLWLIADFIGRPSSAAPSLFLAAAIMVGIQPELMWDISFQLSFTAMIGLLCIVPLFQELKTKVILRSFDKQSTFRSIISFFYDNIAATTAATLVTAGIIALNFHRFSLVTLPANLLAVPALPAIMVCSLLTGFIGLFIPVVAQVTGWVTWLSVSYLLGVVGCFSAIPFASVNMGAVRPWQIAIYYAALVALIYIIIWRGSIAGVLRRCAGLLNTGRAMLMSPWNKVSSNTGLFLLLIMAGGLWSFALMVDRSEFRLSFLNVGQGDAILLQTEGRKTVLIDGGPDFNAIRRELGAKLPFWQRTLDVVVLTHPHEDHLTGLIEVVRRYKVGRVIYSGVNFDSPTYREWLALLREKKIPILIAEEGMQINLSKDESIQFFNVTAGDTRSGATGEGNNLVLRVVKGGISFLLTSDIGQQDEFDLIVGGAQLDSDVLKVAHHGSDTATSERFLDVVSPQTAVISAGKNNPFGHPSSGVMERLERFIHRESIYLTSESGTVTFATDGKRLRVRSER